jgi:hypothetical protein
MNDLAKYLHERMETGDMVNTTFHLMKIPPVEDLEFWIQQHQLRHCAGHSEWSEKFERNIWIKSTT